MKTILGNFVFINEENKSKEIQRFIIYKICSGGFSSAGFLAWGEFVWGVCRGVYLRGGFPDT